MTVKIGINGFGRIGRLAFRRIFELQARGGQAGDIEVAAINDLTTPATLAYLLKYDSTHGTFRHDDGTPVEVTSTDTSIVVDGKEYTVYAEKDANNIPWVKNDGVEYVLECTGFYTSAEKSQAHINAGAKKVLISAPAKDDTTPTIVFGVNHEILKPTDVIVSAGSCTTNSMAAMVKLLNDKFGIKAGFMTTIHAYTGTQMILDGPRGTKTGRNLRAAGINTIAHSTGAAKAIGKVVPEVNGKLQGHAQRIQVPDGSVTELTSVLEKPATADEINAAFKEAFSNTEYFGYNDEGIVSSDIIGDTHGGVFDPTQTDVNTVDGVTLARTVTFYDNEYGFTSNMIRTLLYFAEISE
ncbi:MULTISPECIES: type I glyceraldehyde-3-phosphate dehydrogenase [Bifidobacterium]|uniref:Glyceraldehyde-3-phosphate dehydrogenase n=1 Tax=Bifidobacterium tissieri TaxID=1630162 RepID=A0A261F8H6_9BIFI|nr:MULTISPECIES: type I glyceraldehyde-3-phosphate dehydrogenase [Bifidobacterium]KAA8831500.1 type I glyceraldehyde-3-phosphate dehydrogenase [Bifidobacterium tissieri]KAA8832466.1 type I glyceraldehyde-3-phosphate dehydrogenase [Bifidobacterium tissieri]OZG55365.1 glyceraldehyde-3-phosphate dehydrogenase [Bifidobacterium tissieri]TPF97713.1 glyceraldehyde-3-phosphate dehydrogenase [Bifidobacterium sp. UTCIF-39]